MAREDILGGLKNAIERGENAEDAAKTFIDAGYAENDVREALIQISGERKEQTAISKPEISKAIELPDKLKLIPAETVPAAPKPAKEIPSLPKIEVRKKKKNWLLIAIAVVAALIVGAAAALVWLLMKG